MNPGAEGIVWRRYGCICVISRMIFSAERRKSADILIITVRGQMDVPLVKFYVTFSKATVTLAAGSMRVRSVEKKSMRNFEKALDKTEEM